MVAEGSTVRLECVVAGSPKPSVTWLKNGGALSPSDNIRVLNEGDSSALVIGLVTRRQAGQYTALAANTSGSAFATAELIVLEGTTELFGRGGKEGGKEVNLQQGSHAPYSCCVLPLELSSPSCSRVSNLVTSDFSSSTCLWHLLFFYLSLISSVLLPVFI